MQALHDLVRSGRVRYIGASSMWAHQFALMQFTAEKNGWTKFISMQNQYNLLYREEEREMIKFCDLTGVGLIPVRASFRCLHHLGLIANADQWAPLARGHLARPAASFGSTTRSAGEKGGTMNPAIQYPPPITEADTKIIQRVEEIAKKKKWPMAHVALAWILAKVSSPIIGFSSVERMDEALEVGGKELTEDEVKALEEFYVARGISGHL